MGNLCLWIWNRMLNWSTFLRGLCHVVLMNKMRITYDDWLQMYKGRTVFTITVQEHTIYHKQYKAWRQDNIEKV